MRAANVASCFCIFSMWACNSSIVSRLPSPARPPPVPGGEMEDEGTPVLPDAPGGGGCRVIPGRVHIGKGEPPLELLPTPLLLLRLRL